MTIFIKHEKKTATIDRGMTYVFAASVGLVINSFYCAQINQYFFIISELALNFLCVYGLYFISGQKRTRMILTLYSLCLFSLNYYSSIVTAGQTLPFNLYLCFKLLFMIISVGITFYYSFVYSSQSNDRILGMLAVYFQVSIFWSLIFAFILIYQNGSFYLTRTIVFDQNTANTLLVYLSLGTYYSLITIASLAIGGIFAVSDLARACATIEVTMSHLFIAFLITKIMQMQMTEKPGQAQEESEKEEDFSDL